MRRIRVFALISCLVLIGTSGAQDAPDPEIKKILDRAVVALGGAEKLAQYRDVSWKGKGSFRQADIALVFEGEAFAQGFDRFRQDLALGENQTTNLTIVLTSTKSWVKVAATMPLPEQLEPLRFDCYALALSQRPHTLRNKEFQLSLVGEVQVEGRPALSLRVAHKGWPEVNLCYDKETGLPVKCEVRIKDPATAQEVSDEFFLSEYKTFEGRQHYTKLVGRRNGNEYIQRELSEVRWHEQLPDALFTMP